jgi:hypothetical protein
VKCARYVTCRAGSDAHVACGADATGGTCPDESPGRPRGRIAMGETSRRPVEACSPRSHRRIRAMFRGHEQPGPAPARTWPAAVKCPARLDIAAPPPPRDGMIPRRTRRLAIPWRTALRSGLTRARPCLGKPASSPALLSARPRDLHQRGLGRQPAGPGGRQPAATRDKSRSHVPGPPAPDGPAGRAGPHSAMVILKQVRNTMSERSSSVVYGVTVGKRERNPLMGNMKRSRRTLKWPAGFS